MLKKLWIPALSLLFALAAIPPSVSAGQIEAIQACEHAITKEYGINRFKHVFAERKAHNKWSVHGKARVNGQKYPFTCKVKRGYVQAYYYNGPRQYGKNHSKDNDSDVGTAIGVGLAAIAIAAIASSASDDDSSSSYNKHVNKSYLEDECHDRINQRVNSEHYDSRWVAFKTDSISHQGHKLSGKGRVNWDEGSPSEIYYKCKFNNDGRVIDSSYRIY